MKLLSTLILTAALCDSLPLILSAASTSAPEQIGMNPVVTIGNADTITICRGDTIQLTQTNNVDDAGLVWRPGEGFISSVNDPAPRVAPVVSRFYIVTVANENGTASDSVYIDVNQLVIPQLIADTTVCEGTALPLVQTPVLNARGTRYRYSPGEDFEDANDVNSNLRPRPGRDGVYTLISTSADSICADTQTVTISVTPSRLEIREADTIFRCNDEAPLILAVTASPGSPAAGFTWLPRQGIINQTDNGNITVAPMNDITYFVSAEVNGCARIDSVHVRVDSLPRDLGLRADPEKDPYCMGDTFNLRGNIFDVGDFPLVRHDWINAPGIQSPNDLYEGVFTAVDSALYMRTTTIGACIDTAEIQINVTKPPELTFEPMPAIACPGEPLQVTGMFEPDGPMGTVEWIDSFNTLSCTDCLDPVITTDQSVNYTINIMVEGSDCPFTTTYAVVIAADASPMLNSVQTVCLGDAVRPIVGNIIEGFEYRISGGGQVLLDPTASVSPTETTTYTIETRNPQFGDDSACGTVTQEFTVEVVGDYQLFLDGPTIVCPGDLATFTARVEPPTPGFFTFNLPNETSVSGQTVTTSITENMSEVSVTFVDRLGCSSRTASTTVDIEEEQLDLSILATTTGGAPLADPSVFRGARLVLSVEGLPDDFDGQVTWRSASGGDPEMASGTTVTVTAPDQEGTFSYEATITTVAGCVSTVAITIDIRNEPFTIPEIISANRDGINDDFRVFFAGGTPVESFSLVVFNRFGQEVFNSSDPMEGWDGSKNGAPQNLGTYLFLTRFNIGEQAFEREGQFSLVR